MLIDTVLRAGSGVNARTRGGSVIKGIIFDKDGTLFDFNATWGQWTRGMIASESAGDPGLFRKLADALGYDVEARLFRPGSIVIAATASETADVILRVLPPQD